jgi:hypothetical protein
MKSPERGRQVDEIRPRGDKRGVNLISDVLPLDEAGNVIETHEHAGDFKEW